MFEAIGAAIDEVAADPSVRAVVLHGEGKSFCSGLDLASFAASGQPVESMFERRAGEDANLAQRVSYGWQLMPAPVIAAVHGNCIGGGAQIALGADVRIVAPDASISIREVHWGLIPDMGITRSLPRLVRFDVAKELVLTARIISGEEAVRLGLATTVAADPLAAARALAAEIAGRSPDATRRAKAAARARLERGPRRVARARGGAPARAARLRQPDQGRRGGHGRRARATSTTPGRAPAGIPVASAARLLSTACRPEADSRF